MKKIKTLKKNYEFKYILSKGKFYKGDYITIYLVSNCKKDNNIGIAINNHYSNAVKRNRFKRLIRESYRIIKNDLKNGYNIIFLLNKNIDVDVLNFDIIKKDMIYIFGKMSVLDEKDGNIFN